MIIKSWADCKGMANLTLNWFGFTFKNIEKSGGGTAAIKVRTKSVISKDLSVK